MFDAGALGNFSLAGFEMVIFISKILTQFKFCIVQNFCPLFFSSFFITLKIFRLLRDTLPPISSPTTCHQV